jgi:hypothetical protein
VLALAQAAVDAQRGNDEAGATDQLRAIVRAVLAYQKTLVERGMLIEDEEEVQL